MNLRLAFPSGVAENEVSFSLPFDLSYGGGQTNGVVTVTRERLSIYVDDKLKQTLKVDDYSAFEVCDQIGCSLFRAKTVAGGKWTLICAFSQTYFLRYAELAKILDFYAATGNFVEDTGSDEPTCPTCGANLNGSKQCPFCAKKIGTARRLISFIKPYKKMFITSLVITIGLYALDLVNPYLQRVLVDDIVVAETKDWQLFGIIAVILLVSGALSALLGYISQKLNILISSRFSTDIRKDVFNKTQEMSMKSISRRTPAEIIRRISEDTYTVREFVTRSGKDMIVQSIATITLLIIMFCTNWRLALLVAIPLPFALLASKYVWKFIYDRDVNWWRKTCFTSMHLHDAVSGARVVKSYGSEKREVKRYTELHADTVKAQVNVDTVWYVLSPVVRLLISIGEFLMLYAGASMVLGEEILLGELVQFTGYMSMLYGPLEWLTQLPRQMSQAMVACGKVFELLDETTEIDEKPNALSPELKGNITFDNVFFGYKSYNPVLKGVSCEIKQGEMIGIVGHSGVGKSTFINLLMRLYDPTAGCIKIDGIDLRDMSASALHSQIGVVLQETFLFSGSVYDNIAYAKPDASFDEIVEAAKIANCHDFIVHLPDGYNTYVGEKGYSLSGGERQRVAIARAILLNPKILILDEATASLDTQTEKQIQEALNHLIKGRTTIAIAHRLSTLSSADRLIVLDKGKLVEMGSHSELLRKKGVYYSLVMAQRQTAAMRKAKVPILENA